MEPWQKNWLDFVNVMVNIGPTGEHFIDNLKVLIERAGYVIAFHSIDWTKQGVVEPMLLDEIYEGMRFYDHWFRFDRPSQVKAWKHHVSKDFKPDVKFTYGGPAKPATIFLYYDYMVAFLKKDGREWHICEFYVFPSDIDYNFPDHAKMATLKDNYFSEKGFYKLRL